MNVVEHSVRGETTRLVAKTGGIVNAPSADMPGQNGSSFSRERNPTMQIKVRITGNGEDVRHGDILGGRKHIGEFDLGLDRKAKEVEIVWFGIDQPYRNRGRGSEAYKILELKIAELYPWAKHIVIQPADMPAWRFWKRQHYKPTSWPLKMLEPHIAAKSLWSVTSEHKKRLHKRLS